MAASSPTSLFPQPCGPTNSTATTTQLSRHTPTLLTLPLELHLLIGVHLPFPAHLSLRLTHPYLYHALAAPTHPPSLRELDQCARVAVLTYLAPYLIPISRTTTHEEKAVTPLDPTTGSSNTTTTIGPLKDQTQQQQEQQRCALCGNTYPLRLFKSAASPACLAQDLSPVRTGRRDARSLLSGLGHSALQSPGEEPERSGEKDCRRHGAASNDALARKRRGEAGWDVVELPQRVCCWHVGRLARVVRVDGHAVDTEMRDADATGGVQKEKRGTTGGQNGSRPINRSSPPSLEGSEPRPPPLAWVSRVEQMCTHCGAIQAWRRCRCRCQGCGLRAARTYTRYAEPGWSCAGFTFWRDDGSKLWVRESVVTVGSDGIQFPSFHLLKCVS